MDTTQLEGFDKKEKYIVVHAISLITMSTPLHQLCFYKMQYFQTPKGRFQKRFSGLGGVPPNSAKEKNLLFCPKNSIICLFYAFLALFGTLYGLFGPFLTLFNEKNIIFSPFRKKIPGEA